MFFEGRKDGRAGVVGGIRFVPLDQLILRAYDPGEGQPLRFETWDRETRSWREGASPAEIMMSPVAGPERLRRFAIPESDWGEDNR